MHNFRRRIFSFAVEPAGPAEEAAGPATDTRPQAWVLHVRGSAFLWHQVRCMAAVLLMVGRGQESPDGAPHHPPAVLQNVDCRGSSAPPLGACERKNLT